MPLTNASLIPTEPWVSTAISRIEADFQRSADTHLIALPLPAFEACGIDLYLKDGSTHPTGSLKHRRARSLFLYALRNGWVAEGTTGERYLPTCHDANGVNGVKDNFGDCAAACSKLPSLPG